MIPDFSKARVLIVGDLMLDRYWSGSCSRISPEAPVPVVKVELCQERPGGAGNVALNITALGARATLVGLVGEDSAAANLSTQLAAAGVVCDLLVAPGSATIAKLRVVVHNQQLLRLDFEDGFANFAPDTLVARVQRHIHNCDILLLSDYGKGALREIQPLIALARRAHVPIVVDPKGRNFSRYRGATLITPNFSEFEGVVGHCADEAAVATQAQALRRELELEALLLTRSERGMSLFQRDQPAFHQSARAREIYDVTGAGDTVIATLASAMAVGTDLHTATSLANRAAGIAVSKLGAATVSAAELRTADYGATAPRRGVVTPSVLPTLLAMARAVGEKIVFTNGCFDLLHAGHVDYLARARALGDRLVVAINDDASVRRLKGETRPVNTLADRMAVLAALGAVDWVIPFSEDTPANLIATILPDVLVKGGDWPVEKIVGHDIVRDNGGTVHSLTLIAGRSTTNIVEKISSDTAKSKA